MAAVNVSGPKFRLGKRIRAAGERVRAAADALSEALFSSEPQDELGSG
jgi:DNA-binding IclR family transcriptional regulator